MQQTSTRRTTLAAISQADHATRGQWPADPSLLPYFLNEHQLAHLLGKSVRTLERHRHKGTSVPYIALGRKVLYPRDAVLEYLMKSAKRTLCAA
jgi:hypothetical protein